MEARPTPPSTMVLLCLPYRAPRIRMAQSTDALKPKLPTLGTDGPFGELVVCFANWASFLEKIF